MKHIREYLFVTLSLVLSLLSFPASGSVNEERTAENRVIYEVFVRNFSPEGNLKGVEAQIGRLKDLGIDVIWLMPVYKLGETGKWGPYSSPYSIQDYKRLDPDNGTESDLRDLVKTVHDNGMEIWFDWVGNHTSMDNVWVTSNPEFYTHKDGGFVHPFGGAWKDVYELDRDNEAMQDAMVEAMQYWVDEFDIDGYRCDYASGPSPELWRKASERVLKNGKRVAWLAEDSSRPSLVKNGYFDYNYCWDFQEKVLKHFAQGKNVSLEDLRQASELLANHGLTAGECAAPDDTIKNPYSGRSRMVYLVNHDVVQDQGGTEDIVYGPNLKPLTILEFTLYGMPLIYNGQEIQYKSGGRVSLAERTPIDWSDPDSDMTALIKKLIDLKHTHPALKTGMSAGYLENLVTTKEDVIYAYKKIAGKDDIVVMLNFSDKPQQFQIKKGLPKGKYKDIISGETMQMEGTASFTLPPHGGAVYTKE